MSWINYGQSIFTNNVRQRNLKSINVNILIDVRSDQIEKAHTRDITYLLNDVILYLGQIIWIL